MNPITLIALFVSLALFTQSLFSLYLMLYAWERPERLHASRGPRSFAPPLLSFTVLLPARHEVAVIYETIQRVWAADYPSTLLEIIVICHADDTGTIAEAQRAIRDIGARRVRVETFATPPINKPHGLNVGLHRTSNQVVTIFDAEDDIDPNIFNLVNTVMVEEEAGIVQAGVQLMNFRDHWFAVHNCLEYFFWFKSRLHFHAAVGMIPLGGNTVFIRRHLLERVGGWNEHCLTEDAEIGLRLSVLGEPIRVVYDAQRVTREETPDTVGSFIRQRTRWQQGFLQVLRKGSWRGLPHLGQRLLALYTLSYPFLQALLTLLWPLTVMAVLWLKPPVLVAMATFLPLYALLLQFVASVVGAFMFARDYDLTVPLLMPLHMALTFMPFQWLQGFSAVRAVYRELRRQHNWEKTTHLGAHRQPALALQERFAKLLAEVCGRLGVERGSVMMLDSATNSFSLLASCGLPDAVQAARLTRSDGVADWVAQTRRPVVMDGRPLPDELAGRLGQPHLRSSIVVPIAAPSVPLAVVSVSSTRTALGDKELQWLCEHITATVLRTTERQDTPGRAVRVA